MDKEQYKEQVELILATLNELTRKWSKRRIVWFTRETVSLFVRIPRESGETFIMDLGHSIFMQFGEIDQKTCECLAKVIFDSFMAGRVTGLAAQEEDYYYDFSEFYGKEKE